MSAELGASGGRIARWLGLVPLALLAVPFAGLIWATDWRHFRFAPGDATAIWVSLGYGVVALAIVVALGTPLAWWLSRLRSRIHWLVDGLLLMGLLTPPLAMGLLLATVYGPYGPIGGLLSRTGTLLTNSPAAFVLAQFYAALPYYVVAARAAFSGVPGELQQIGLTLGRSPTYCFFTLTVPLARLGLAVAVALAWVRILGEFGVVLIVAYYPRGIPVKLWVNLQEIGLSAVYPLLWIFFLVAIPLPLLVGLAVRKKVA
ncbi:MAG TPA: hypothetical protein VF292_08895 [Rhodanobacteraceae bacterium]